MPDKKPSDRTVNELLAASKKLADRAAKASREMGEIADEMEANRALIEKRMKEQRRSVN